MNNVLISLILGHISVAPPAGGGNGEPVQPDFELWQELVSKWGSEEAPSVAAQRLLRKTLFKEYLDPKDTEAVKMNAEATGLLTKAQDGSGQASAAWEILSGLAEDCEFYVEDANKRVATTRPAPTPPRPEPRVEQPPDPPPPPVEPLLKPEDSFGVDKFLFGKTSPLEPHQPFPPLNIPYELGHVSLRDYQNDAVDTVVTRYQAGSDRSLVVLPTGTGKTVMFAEFTAKMVESYLKQQKFNQTLEAGTGISRLFGRVASFLGKWDRPERVIIITHREEIIEQDKIWLGRVVGETNVGIVKGEQRQWEKPVVIASIQTLIQNGVDLRQFGLVILDEAHHYVNGNTWFEPLKGMGFFDEAGNKTYNWPRALVGVTATPDRLEGPALNTTFGEEGLVYEKDITYFINRVDPATGRPYLLKPHGIEVQLKSEGINDPVEALKRTSAEDKAGVITEVFYDRLHHGDKFQKAIIFVSNKEEVEIVTHILNEHNIRAVGITDDTPTNERKTELAAYKRGEYDALVNVNIATEGFDDPGTEAVFLFRATDSRSLTVQMVGRSLRPDPNHPERNETIIVDAGQNLRRHNIGADVRELYEMNNGRLVSKPPPSPGTPRIKKPDVELVDVEITDIGDIVGGQKQTQFMDAMRKIMSTPGQVQTVAYKLGVASDRLFAYWNGLAIPENMNEVRRIAEKASDTASTLADAWSWDKVLEMDVTEPLPKNLKPAIRTLARHARFSLWRKFDGFVSRMVVSQTSPIRTLLTIGELPENNQGGLPLREFYDQLQGKLTASGASETEAATLITDAIKAQRGWDKPIAGLPTAIQELLDVYRGAVIKIHGGEIPTVGVSEGSPLRGFLGTGELPKSNRGFPLRKFYSQLQEKLTASGVSEAEAITLITDAIKAQRGWDKPIEGLPPAIQKLLDAYRGAVIKIHGGGIPKMGDDAISQQSPPRRFLDTGELQESNKGSSSLRKFYNQLQEKLTASGVSEAEAVTLITDAIKAQRGWGTIEGLPPAIQKLLDAYRGAVIKIHGGESPARGGGAASSYRSLQRFLDTGELMKSSAPANRDKFYSQLQAQLTQSGISEAEARTLVTNARAAQQSTPRPTASVLSYIEHGASVAETAETPAEARLRETRNRPVEFFEAVREYLTVTQGRRLEEDEIEEYLKPRGARSKYTEIMRVTGLGEAELERVIEALPLARRGRPSPERPEARTGEARETKPADPKFARPLGK